MQVISATDDGKEFDSNDAQLELDNGTPRSPPPLFFLMLTT